jgi:hypothetical protein
MNARNFEEYTASISSVSNNADDHNICTAFLYLLLKYKLILEIDPALAAETVFRSGLCCGHFRTH